jgi:hypothetical protein
MEFETNEALVRWMEDQGLSPFTLLKVSPKPTAKGKKVPASVVMEWGLEDLEHEGDREKFLAWRVTAEEVEVFGGEGKMDPFEECHTELGDGTGIDVRLEAGGTLVLRCARLVVGDEPVERSRKGRPRPHHGEVNLDIELSTATWQKVREWFGIPAKLACARHLTVEAIDAEAKLRDGDQVTFDDSAGHNLLWMGVGANRLHISRGKWASDELWSELWSRINSVPGVTRISSRDLVCAPGAWPEQPPPKPAPQVWPNVFGVTCDFNDLTLDGLRQALKLPASMRFVFDDDAAPEARPALTLGEAARHEGGEQVNGAFQNPAGKALVHCWADLRESSLRLTRQPACDDATWLGVWRAHERLPGVREIHSRTTQSPPDPWPLEPPKR